MIKVRVQNCQSIRDASIVVDGFTVVTGQNNSGKTAFMRACRGVFTNAPAGALVRHGESHLTVTMEFENGDVLVWEKGPKVNRYTLNSKTYEQGGRGAAAIPDEIRALGVYGVSLSNKDVVWPQFATQFSGGQFSGPVFLLDKPGSVMAEVIADVERVGKLSTALKAAESDRRAAASELKIRREDERKTSAELVSYDNLPEAVSMVDSVESTLALCDKTGMEIVALTNVFRALLAAQAEVAGLKSIGEYQLPDTGPLAAEAQRALADATALSKLSGRYVTLTGAVRQYAGIVSVPLPSADSGQEARKLAAEFSVLQKLGGTWLATKAETDRLQGIQEIGLPDTALTTRATKSRDLLVSLRALETRRESARRQIAHWNSAQAATSKVEIADRSADLSSLSSESTALVALHRRLVKARSDFATLQAEMTSAESLLSKERAEVSSLMASLPECPTCRTPMKETHLHREIS